MNRRAARAGRTNPARGIEICKDAHGEAVATGHERAHVVAKALGEHGEHAIDEVGRASAGAGLQIDRIAPAHVVRDVRNVDAQTVAAVGRPLAGNGVIEVTRRGRVNRDAKQVAQVLAPGLCGEHLARVLMNPLRLCQRRLAKVHREAVAGDDALDGKVKAVRPTDAALDRNHASLITSGIREDACLDHIALGNAQSLGALIVWQDEEVATNTLVERHHGTQRPRDLEGSHEALASAMEHPLDHGLRTTRATMHEHDGSLIAVHSLAKAAASHEEGALGRLDRSGSGTRNAERSR